MHCLAVFASFFTLNLENKKPSHLPTYTQKQSLEFRSDSVENNEAYEYWEA